MSYEIHTLDALREVMPLTDKRRRLLDDRVYNYVDEFSKEFIANSPMLFIAATNASGHVDVTAKGDMPGFVKLLEDKKTLLFPERSGNNDARIFRNIIENNQVALVFVVPKMGEVLRVTGRAVITRDPELLEQMVSCGKPAVICLKITVDECFFNCKRAFNRSHIWNPEKWTAEVKPYMAKQASLRSMKEKDLSKHMTVERYNELTDEIIDDLGEKDGAF